MERERDRYEIAGAAQYEMRATGRCELDRSERVVDRAKARPSE